MGVDENVGRNVKSRQGMVEPHYLPVPASFRPEWFGFHDDQVNIGILALVAARTGTEQDHLLWIDLVDDGLDHAVQKCISHRRHRSIGADFDAGTTSIEWVPHVKKVKPPEVPVMGV